MWSFKCNDVVAQAIKNLKIINLFDPKTPKYTERWAVEPWEGLGNEVGNSINRRILPATGRGRSMWTRNILPKVKDANIDKVVVCMLSNGLNKNYFKNQINNSSGGMYTESVHTYFFNFKPDKCCSATRSKD